MTRSKHGNCGLCQRRRDLTFHHLIPRTLHSNKRVKRSFTREAMQQGLDLCRDCHSAIHTFVSEKDLGWTYNTREALLEHPEIAKFVAWVATRRGRYRAAPTRR